MTFGRTLRRRRMQKGWTMKDLAKLTGYQYSWIVALEKREFPPDSYTLIRKLMKCFPDWDILGEYGSDLELLHSRKQRRHLEKQPNNVQNVVTHDTVEDPGQLPCVP